MAPLSNPSSVLVAGAGGVLGREVVRILRVKGVDVIAAFRTCRAGLKETLLGWGAKPLQLDITDTNATRQALAEVDAAIFTPILTVSQSAAAVLGEGQRAVFFSSNNVAIDPTDAVYTELLRAETMVLDAALSATILRPTMIYGYPGDGNLSKLIAVMRRTPVIPSPGNGDALQQPVFYRDLARIAVKLLFDPPSERIAAIAGPKPVSQRVLYRMAADAAGARPAVIGLPVSAFAPVLRLLERAGVSLPVKSAQLRRSGLHKIPRGDHIILTDTPLEEGLSALAAGLDDRPGGA